MAEWLIDFDERGAASITCPLSHKFDAPICVGGSAYTIYCPNCLIVHGSTQATIPENIFKKLKMYYET